jgi:Bacterial Ig-like domain (group 3)
MKFVQRLLLVAGALFVCQFSVGTYKTAAATAGNEPASTADTTVPSQNARTKNTMLIRASSNGVSAGTSVAKTITISMPAETRPETIQVVLNGKDVTSKFHGTTCSEGVCESGTLSSADGLRSQKNVLYAIGRKSDGTLASSRLRFNGQSPVAAVAPRSQTLAKVSQAGLRKAQNSGAVSNSAADTNFLPSAVIFKTLTPGGWNGSSPWIQIGTEQLPDAGFSCPGPGMGYLVVVVDRQTLQEIPGGTQCEGGSYQLATYLQSLPNTQIAIVGTDWEYDAAGDLDTSAIGGTNYTPLNGATSYPLGYMAIGAGGAAPGSAYENFYTKAMNVVFDPFATGVLVEDAYANYNFQSSVAVEYLVTPNDPTNNNQSTVTLFNMGSFFRYNQFTYPGKVVFYSTANQTNGFWLMKLQRDSLDNLAFNTNCGAAANQAKQQTDVTTCGTFYATGASDAATQVSAFTQLASDLNALNPDQLAFLVSVGTPFNATSSYDLAARSSQGQYAYYHNFADALENVGGVPMSTLSLYTPGSAYALVTCAGCGGPLTGNVALSSTTYAQQGQTGTLHGILQRNLNGLYWSGRSSQETAGSTAGADYTLDLLNSQDPVEWPELSGTLLNGASSITGQVAAYHFASYQLITQYYIKGAQGDYLDDIHYYFAGSLNALLDYHTFDPVHLTFPGQGNICYVWTDPVTNQPLDCFTPQDLQAVAQQLSTEIVDLDNVLQFMVTGSTNMKDVVTTGNGSAALALIGAAASIEGSNLQPTPSTKVGANVSNILNLVSSLVNIAVTVGTDGVVPPDLVNDVTKGGSVISSLFGAAGSVAGGLNGPGSPDTALPSPQYTFTTTIGNLANSSLQQQFAVGFDTQLDGILGDWGKLSQLGPLVTDTGNPAFYSPNQVAQNVAVTLLGQGSQRAFYTALLPSFYSVHYYPAWYGLASRPVNPPDIGVVTGQGICQSWYSWWGPNNTITLPPNVSRTVPTYAGTPNVWEITTEWPAYNPVDHYIIAGSIHNAGQSGKNYQTFSFIDQQVANQMFSSGALNIPFDEFVTKAGPMASVFKNGATDNFIVFPVSDVNACYDYPQTSVASGGTSASSATTTTLSAPATSVLGEDVTLQASVTTSSGPVPSGTVTFFDGTTQVGQATLANGTATFSTSSFALGTHSIEAYYVVNTKYSASSSGVSTLTVYANSPDITISFSTGSVNVAYGSTSSPIALQIASRSGLAGTVTLGCAGLPVGVTCNFNPSQPTITAAGQATSSLTISAIAIRSAGIPVPKGAGAILLAPVYLLLLWRIRKDARKFRMLVCALLLSVLSLGCLSACSGGSKTTQPISSSQTILVIATSGTTTKSTPLILNLQ